MHFLLIILNKPNLLKCASIDLNSFACCFPDVSSLLRTIYESEVLSFVYATTTSILQRFNLMLCCVALCNNYAICNTLQTALNCNAICNTSYFKLSYEGGRFVVYCKVRQNFII